MRILIVVAHPDDEVLWMWPVMQEPEVEKFLFVVSDNHQGYGEKALLALSDMQEREGWLGMECAGLGSNFYALPTRRVKWTLTRAARMIQDTIFSLNRRWEFDVVMTHNPVGEYGHGDHKLVSQIGFAAAKQMNLPVLFTDICMMNKSHVCYETIPDEIWKGYYRYPVRGAEKLDVNWFERCKAIYQKHQAWSWSSDVAVQCGLYEV